jgi:uncharacterized RDD family membrane protein YckC
VAQREGIVTPEAVLLQLETAGIPSRALAKAIDVVIAGFAVGVFLTVGVLLASSEMSDTLAAVLVLVATTLAFIVYPAVAEARWGTTAGKAACGLRVVTVEGGPVRGRHALIRAALQLVDLVLVPIGVVAVLSSLFSPLDQRLGDRVAGTLVLRSRAAAAHATALVFPPLPGYEAYVASLDVSGVTAEQYEVLRSFLTRVAELQPEARFHLADLLAKPLAAAMAHAMPPHLHPELFCACVASAYQQRHGAPAWA